jgi:hypothetical protein
VADKLTQRDADAARYRAEGWTYQRIANELGFANPSSAHKAVQRALKASVRDANDTAVHLELNSLDEMAREAWGVLQRTHVVVSQGRVVELDGAPVPDDAPVLAAIDRLLKIQERRSKLLGLDMPTRSTVQVITEDSVDQAIAELEAQIDERSRATD